MSGFESNVIDMNQVFLLKAVSWSRQDVLVIIAESIKVYQHNNANDLSSTTSYQDSSSISI